MSANDTRIDEIERQIRYEEDSRKKAQDEVTHFMRELERINREIKHYSDAITDSDHKISNLRDREKNIRDEIARESRMH